MEETGESLEDETRINRLWQLVGIPSSASGNDLSYLHCVVFKGRSDLLKDYFERCQNVSLSAPDVFNRTVFHIAATHGHYQCLKVLCAGCSNKDILNAKDCYKYTALHYTAQNAQAHCTKLLLENGADPDTAQHSGSTPLHLAAVNGFARTVMLLCQHGANVHARNFFGETPLLMASRSGIGVLERLKIHLTILAILLRFGSDPNAHDGEGMTPLHHVVMLCNSGDCAGMLCQAGASLRARNALARTAIDLARSTEVRNLLRGLTCVPLRLEQWCLLCIRRSLGMKLNEKVPKLPLSTPIKDRLLFKAIRDLN